MHLKISSAKWRPFWPGRDELIDWYQWRHLLGDNNVDYVVCLKAQFMSHTALSNQKWQVLHKYDMMTSSNGNIFRVTGHLCGEFTGLRWIPRTKASDAELWYFLWCARLSKHSRGWSFETLSHPLWRHRNDISVLECLSTRSPSVLDKGIAYLIKVCNFLRISGSFSVFWWRDALCKFQMWSRRRKQWNSRRFNGHKMRFCGMWLTMS